MNTNQLLLPPPPPPRPPGLSDAQRGSLLTHSRSLLTHSRSHLTLTRNVDARTHMRSESALRLPPCLYSLALMLVLPLCSHLLPPTNVTFPPPLPDVPLSRCGLGTSLLLSPEDDRPPSPSFPQCQFSVPMCHNVTHSYSFRDVLGPSAYYDECV